MDHTLVDPGIRVIYEDNHLLVVEKPANMLSQGDRTGDPDLLTLLKSFIKQRDHKPGNVYLGLVHRLDRPVGGVMVFAKTSKAAQRLALQLREQVMIRRYLAVVTGVVAEPRGRLVHYVAKDSRTNMVRAADQIQIGGKKAVLFYQVLDIKSQQSLVLVSLQTGRPHQIRVQFAQVNHPIIGDQRYGTGSGKNKGQIGLWSHLISFSHPTLGKQLEFRCLPPFDRYPWSLFANYWKERA